MRKREIASYILLWKAFKDKGFNMYEAINILEIFMSRKVAFKVFKNLNKFGMVKKINTFEYVVEEPTVWFWRYLKQYLASRLERNFKSRGYSGFQVKIVNDTILVVGLKFSLKPKVDFINFVV